MIKRQVVMADGRYLIFYIFAPSDHPGSSDRVKVFQADDGVGELLD